MILNVKQEDIDKAIEEVRTNDSVSRCCPIYQACKRTGILVIGVGHSVICLSNISIPLPFIAYDITFKDSRYWNTIKPVQFEIPYELES